MFIIEYVAMDSSFDDDDGEVVDERCQNPAIRCGRSRAVDLFPGLNLNVSCENHYDTAAYIM